MDKDLKTTLYTVCNENQHEIEHGVYDTIEEARESIDDLDLPAFGDDPEYADDLGITILSRRSTINGGDKIVEIHWFNIDFDYSTENHDSIINKVKVTLYDYE